MDELLDRSPAGFLTLDDTGRIVAANATLCEWLGFEARGLDGRPIDTILSVGGRIFYQTHLFPLLKLHGRADEIYFSLKARDGSALPVLTNAVRRERGGVFASDCVFLPMRQRREFEDELVQARKAADQASEAKAKFLSMMSHELRTPMNAILGFAQLLEMDSLKPSQHGYVGQILRAGEHLLELINDVLDMSRIEAGMIDISPEPIRAEDVMREAFEMAGPLASRAGLEIAIAACANGASVHADRIRVRQLLLNLLSNAIKYNRRGGEVRLACEVRHIGEANMVRFAVHDTGPGIAADKLEKLFKPFERLGAEVGTIEGTGLGLALSKRLAEAMGGAIGVESTEGEGSCFWVDLPGTVRDEKGTADDRVADDAVAEPARPAAQAVVLYIEDERANLHLVRKSLEHRPRVRVVDAMTAAAGLELARTASPDLILLDLQLPDRSGEEVLADLRNDPATGAIPVVVVSADATPRTIDRLLKAGARDYLTKPFALPRLFKVIDELVPEHGLTTKT